MTCIPPNPGRVGYKDPIHIYTNNDINGNDTHQKKKMKICVVNQNREMFIY